ncbi:MAG: type II secretion system F family protein [Clostridiales bacterium]|nr:type II secretion system F family protein [Clostridiales bacterium]
MQYFDYRAKTRLNKRVTGIMTGDTAEQVKNILISGGYNIEYVKPMWDIGDIRKWIYTHIKMKIKFKHIYEFIDQLAFLMKSNVQSYMALETLRDKSEDEHTKYIARILCEEVRRGVPLWQAMEKSGFFTPSIVHQVQTGEESGGVEDALGRIATQLEADMDFKRRIKSACIYPITIFVLLVVITWLLMTLVVPTVVENIVEMGCELPALTRFTMGMSKVVKVATLPAATAVAIIIIAGKKICKERPDIKVKIDRIYTKIPLIGNMVEKISMKEFSKQLSIMLESNMSLAPALRFVEKTVKNTYEQTKIRTVRRYHENEGLSLAVAMQNEGTFDPMLVQMVMVGNDTGEMAEVLDKMSLRYMKDVDAKLKKITSIIEPCMIVLVGIVVGFIMVSLYLPMFSMIDSIA